ncbi:hypothetical protein BJV77DRAFT_240927 [Russula vinacea]|nr:hypothetical protein BJV77DRAFT_240927 [Russula vinacea]
MWLCAVLDIVPRRLAWNPPACLPHVAISSVFLDSFFNCFCLSCFLALLCFRCPLAHQYTSDFFSLPSFLADSACPTLASRISIFSGRHAPPLIVVTGTNINSFVAFHGVFFMSKDSVKCYKCRGAHISEANDKQCTKKHVVAGICDGSPKCLNCHNAGHTA